MKLANILWIVLFGGEIMSTSCQHRQMPPMRCSPYLYEGQDVGISTLHLKEVLQRHPEARIGNPAYPHRHDCWLRIRPEKKRALFERLERDMPFVREFIDMLPDAMPKAGDVGITLPIYDISSDFSSYENCANILTFLTSQEMDYYFEPEGNTFDNERNTPVNWSFWADGFMRGENIEESVKWWEDELRAGNTANLYNLAHSYHMGWVKGKSSSDAIPLYKRAIECGGTGKTHYAQYELGTCYRDGVGVPQSYQEAVKWFRQAAETDFFAEAQYELGCCYMEGKGIERSRHEAIKWFRKAAQNEYKPAQIALQSLLLFE